MKIVKRQTIPNKVEQLLENKVEIEMTEAQALIVGALLARSGEEFIVKQIENIIEAWNINSLILLNHEDIKKIVTESLRTYASDIRSPFDNYFRNV